MPELTTERAGRIELGLKQLLVSSHEQAIASGFWDGIGELNELEVGGKIALMHSELSEALEAVRDGYPPDKHCPEFSSVEIEFADLLIRMGDLCSFMGLRLEDAVVAKMNYNASRPYKHGKTI